MNLKYFTLITLLSLTDIVHAENHLLVLGGAGDPKGFNTIFDQDLMNLGSNLENSTWKYDISFNGGHGYTEGLIKRKFSKTQSTPTSFTVNNFKKLINSYKLKIENNEIKSGDQIMLLINSHGAKRQAGQKSHYIGAVSTIVDSEGVAGLDYLNLDDLQEIIKLTNQKGIKLGIVDLSCQSGATLALKEKAQNTCIIAATSADHYSFGNRGSFTDNFVRGLKPGLSLEEIFLKARLEANDSGYPVISTAENDIITKEVYAGITPYLYYYNATSDKMTPYVLENGTMSLFCKRDDDFNKLISKIDNLKSVLNSKHNSFNADLLKDLLLEYKKIQDNVLMTSMKLGSFKLDAIENFSTPENTNNDMYQVKLSYTWKELLDLDVQKSIQTFRNFMELPLPEKEREDAEATIHFLEGVNARKQQILKENPQLATYKDQTTLLVKQMNTSQELAKKIAKQEKNFYEELYRRNQTNNPDDPCKKIIF